MEKYPFLRIWSLFSEFVTLTAETTELSDDRQSGIKRQDELRLAGLHAYIDIRSTMLFLHNLLKYWLFLSNAIISSPAMWYFVE